MSKPSGVASGDLLVIVACCMKYTAGTAISVSCTGFTLRAQDPTKNRVSVAILDRVADGSEGASFSVSLSNVDYGVIHCLRVTGADAAPFDTSTTADSADAFSTSHNIPSITTSADDELLIAGNMQWTDDLTGAPPAGWSGSSATSGSGADGWVFYKSQASAGASGSTSLTTTPDSDIWASVVGAWKSASAASDLLPPPLPRTNHRALLIR